MDSVEFDRLDSLEGWVAVKSNIFEESEPFKLGFIVQWNAIESKFAVTCHNRTLQRQKRKAEVPAGGQPQMSWAGLFSVNDLKHVHQQFTCVADVLGGCFPDLSDFGESNIWDLLLSNRRSGGPEDDDQRDFDTPCRKLEKYFSTAIDLCGRKIVLETLFTQDERDVDEYFENLQEFKKKTMQEEMSRAKGQLKELLQSHSTTNGMVALLSIYEKEDEAYQDLVTVATSFFQYLLQPFRDMRELACLYKMEILKSLEFEDLGPKRIAALEKEAEEWRMKAEDAVASIQDITVNYFAQTSKALAGMVKQMEEDKKRQAAISSSKNRDCRDWLLDSTLGRWFASRQLVLSNIMLLKVLLWLVLLGLFVELEFGLPFFVISLFYWLYEGLRSPEPRKPGELSAYSVFNPDCQPLLGSLTAEQLEGEMGYRPLANR